MNAAAQPTTTPTLDHARAVALARLLRIVEDSEDETQARLAASAILRIPSPPPSGRGPGGGPASRRELGSASDDDADTAPGAAGGSPASADHPRSAIPPRADKPPVPPEPSKPPTSREINRLIGSLERAIIAAGTTEPRPPSPPQRPPPAPVSPPQQDPSKVPRTPRPPHTGGPA